MGDLVHNALRRKLAAAQAIGDSKRIDRLRELLGAPAASSEVPANVVEVVQPSISQENDSPDVTDVDGEVTLDADW